MKKLVYLLLFCVSFATAQDKNSAEAIVQKQVEAYNAQNVAAFLENFSDDIEIYTFPNRLIRKGKEAYRKVLIRFFKKYPELHCEIVSRTAYKNTVVDHERIKYAEDDYSEVIAIYKIKDGKIAKVYFVRD